MKALTTFVCCMLISYLSIAQIIPQRTNFQGVLTDSNGDVLNGSFSLTFKIYNVEDGGSALWEETHSSVAVTDGLFSVILGSQTSLELPYDELYFLSFQRGSESELSPRLVFTQVPYASSVHGVSNFIPSSGNVGIGTISPSQKLDVNGTVKATSFEGDGSALTGISGNDNLGNHTATQNIVMGSRYLSGDGADEGIKIESNGRVYARGNGSTNGSSFAPTIDVSIDDNDTGLDVPADGTLVLYTNNQEQARLSVGRFGIGTTIPNSRVHINAPAGQDALRIQMDGNTRFFMNANGDVIIGAFADPQFTLDVRGTIGNNGTLYHSDRRWKKNINSLHGSLTKINQLRGVTYEWKADDEQFKAMKFERGLQIGFIAQEVEKVIPDLVHTDKDGYKSVKYANVTAILVEAIKDQQSIIDSLKDQLNGSEAKYDALSSRLASIEKLLKSGSLSTESKVSNAE